MELHEALATVLTGPDPCDGCRWRACCAETGAACVAFREYCGGASHAKWGLMPKQPRLDIGQRLGLAVKPAA